MASTFPASSSWGRSWPIRLPLAPEHGYYQRLLARDQGEAADLIERYIKTESSPRSIYDVLLLPALNYAERDRLEQRLSQEEELVVIETTRELLSDAADSIRRLQPEAPPGADAPLPTAPRESLRIIGYASNGVADELALAMLAHLLDDLPISVEITTTRMQASELVSLVQVRGVSVVCLADLPPSPSSKTRYLVKRLRAAFPELRILVGRWAPPPWRTKARRRCARPGRITWHRLWRKPASTSVALKRFRGCPSPRRLGRDDGAPGRDYADWLGFRGGHPQMTQMTADYF